MNAPLVSSVLVARPLLATLLGAALLGGCVEPQFGMRGTVRSAAPCPAGSSRDGSAPPPVVGARVTFSCPNKPDLLVAVTDAEGRFEALTKPATMSHDPGCALVVEKEGFATRRYSLEEICLDSRHGATPSMSPEHNPEQCHLVGASALLAPATAPKAGTP